MANNTGLKFGGRQAGTPNKMTNEMRQIISDFLSANLIELQSSFDQLSPKDKLIFIEKLFKHVLPPLSHLDTDQTENDGFNLEKYKSAFLESLKIEYQKPK